jgi:hypothetical protein
MYDFLGNRVSARAAVEMQMTPGDQPPLHVHHREDEGFAVLDGELTLFQPGRSVTLRAGEVAVAERGVPHCYLAGPHGARVLVTGAEDGFAPFTAEVAAIGGKPSPEELAAIAARYDIEILGPPGARP